MRPMLRGRPTRAPYPYDIVIVDDAATRTGLMLLHDPRYQQAGLAGEHPDPLQAAQPTEFAYSAQNPGVESTAVYDDLVLGFGQRLQQTSHDRRYRFASNADCSIGGQIILGPRLTTVTPSPTVDATNGISHFFEIGGSLYALNGRYALKRTGDAAADWAVSKDFGAGKAALDVIVTKQNGGSTTYAYVAMGDSEFMYRFDGTTWTQHASLFARAFCLAGRDLYRAHDTNKVAKVDTNSDPWTAANWSADESFYIGSADSAIARMSTTASGALLIFKTDGVYGLDEQGNDLQLYSDLKLAPSSDNGKYTFKFENWIHLTMGGRHFRIGPDLGIEPVGPERFAENDTPVSGYITAGVGTPYAAYAGIYNPDTDDSYLLKFGAYPQTQDGDPERIDAWHGSLSGVTIAGISVSDVSESWANQKIAAMYRTSIGAPTIHERCYIGSSTGTITYFILPCSPNPVACSSYQYGTGAAAKSGFVMLPFWHGGFPKNEKVIGAVTGFGTKLTATSALGQFRDRISGAGSGGNYSGFPTDASLWADSTPGERMAVTKTHSLADFGIRLTNSASAATTDTPIVNGFAVHFRVNVPIQQIFDLYILCEDGLLKRDGTPMRLGATQIRANVRTALGYTDGVTLILPDERSLTVQLADFAERMEWHERTKKWRAVVHVKAIQSDVDLGVGAVSLS